MPHPVFTRNAYRDTVVGLAPISYWRLKEAGGTRAYDEMAKTNGTYVGGIAQGVAGPISDGAGVKTSNGSGKYVTGGADTFPQTAFTLACWLYLTATSSNSGIFGRWTSPGGGSFLWIDANSPNGLSLVYTTNASNYLRPGVAISQNRWHFCVGTWDGATSRLYVDGLQLTGGSKSISTAPGTPTTNWEIGTYNNVNQITNGSLAEAAYWNRALSAADIWNLAAIGFGR